jgi:hypothetical protein
MLLREGLLEELQGRRGRAKEKRVDRMVTLM